MRAAEHGSSSLRFQPAGQDILSGPHSSTQGRRTLDGGAREQVVPPHSFYNPCQARNGTSSVRGDMKVTSAGSMRGCAQALWPSVAP